METIPVTTVGSLNGIQVEFSIGEANHLQFDHGTHTVHIRPEEKTERILVDVNQLGFQDLLQTHVIRKMKIEFELEDIEQGDNA